MKLSLSIVAVLVTIFLASYYLLFYSAFFFPKFEQVRRNTYTQSESYVRGVIQDVQKLQLEYLSQKDPIVKKALAETIKQTISGVDINSFPPNLITFIQSLEP
jgi:hypothetical protein